MWELSLKGPCLECRSRWPLYMAVCGRRNFGQPLYMYVYYVWYYDYVIACNCIVIASFSSHSFLSFCHSAFSFASPTNIPKTMTTFLKGPYTSPTYGSPWIFVHQDYPIYLVFDLDMVHLTTLDRKIMGQMVRRRLRHATGHQGMSSKWVFVVDAC